MHHQTEWDMWYDESGRFDRMLEGYGNALLDAAGVAAGWRVLDVGCGAGATTVDAAERVGPAGSAVGIDVNGRLLERARQRADGRANVRFVRGDAAAHPYCDSFDAIISRFAMMLFSDRRSGFGHLAGALRPGGTITYLVWTEPRANAWFALPFELLGREVPLDQAGPFGLADPDENRDLLTANGFADITIDRLSLPVCIATDVDDAAEFLRRFMGAHVGDPELVDRAVEQSRPLFSEHATGDGVVIPTRALLCHARRPALP